MAARRWRLMQSVIISGQGAKSLLRLALGRDLKARLFPVLYLAGAALAFLAAPLVDAVSLAVALMWLSPDPRVEAVLKA
jgi:hypothetical protein